MRKQYHLRKSERGLLAWDVDRLIGLAAGLDVIDVPLSEIRELDEPYWYESGGGLPTCRSVAAHMRLVEAADLAWPIIMGPDGRVMDGMHRVVKALLAGRRSVPARRLPVMPGPDHVGVDPDDLPCERD